MAIDNQRREFITLLGGAAAECQGQQPLHAALVGSGGTTRARDARQGADAQAGEGSGRPIQAAQRPFRTKAI
jgi:hypothetical protein